MKNIIWMYFGTKNTLKSYRNRTPKQAIKVDDLLLKNIFVIYTESAKEVLMILL